MSIFDNLRDGRYTNNKPYPKGRRRLPHRATDAEITEVERNQRLLEEYRNEDARMNALFRKDLEEECGMTGHPKADLLFDKAWDLGHSSGFNEVAIYYTDLVELVK